MKQDTLDGRSSRWDAHRRTRRRELLRSVRKAIDAHGESLSMDALAETTGTSKTVFYRYFGDRNGLTRAMADWATGVIRTSIDEAGQAEADPYRSLRSMIAALVGLGLRSPGVYRFCDSALTPDTGSGALHTDVASLLCARMGLTDAEGRMWAQGAVGFVRSCTAAWLDAPTDPEDFTAQLADWLWASRPRTPD
ncbi:MULTISPECIES: TetR/AcrR family transcriptional regulator [Brevibacterium]|jgi:AcrR family transcriptional regulator|uniref:TetR/AcrR family transcriptional regulator n=1 Tax=Brevibacterium salitolerans TaxID=1403566 RepID=A0ABP5I2T8_9MICO|nr:TetR/AcrR family transcriptional regulator [Brevibacterium sp.]